MSLSLSLSLSLIDNGQEEQLYYVYVSYYSPIVLKNMEPV